MDAPRSVTSGVVLDIDGTLIDSNDAHAHAWTEALRAYGHEVPFYRVRRCIGMGGDRLLSVTARIDYRSRHGADIVEAKRQFFSALLPGLHATRGARSLLRQLLEEGLHLVTATAGSDDESDALLRAAGVDDLIAARVSGDDVSQSKPAADVIQAALARLSLPAEQAFMIGDTPYDITAARRTAVPIVALRCGGFWADDSLALANLICDDPESLRTELGNLGSPGRQLIVA